MASLPSVRITKATNKANNLNNDKVAVSCTYNFAAVLKSILNALIIECSITVERHTMLQNGMMLKDLNKL